MRPLRQSSSHRYDLSYSHRPEFLGEQAKEKQTRALMFRTVEMIHNEENWAMSSSL